MKTLSSFWHFQLQKICPLSIYLLKSRPFSHGSISITKQLCHWSVKTSYSRSSITSCQIWFIILFPVSADKVSSNYLGHWVITPVQIYSNMISKGSRFFWSERWRVSILLSLQSCLMHLLLNGRKAEALQAHSSSCWPNVGVGDIEKF